MVATHDRRDNAGPARSRRGRPYRLPEDPTPLPHVHGGAAPRVAWLLATSRVYAQNPAISRREEFVAALRDLGLSADPTRISRWESGASHPGSRIITGYERVLGLRQGQLSVVAEGVVRSLDPEAPDPRDWFEISSDQIHAELDALFERIASGQTHGMDWLRLTARLTSHEQVYLRPHTWAETANLLVTELCRSVGIAYIRRYEAMRLLVRHPVAQRHAVKALGAFVTHPHAQVVAQPLTLLQEVSDRQASELVLRMLRASPGMLRRGAAWVAASKLARSHFDPEGQAELEAMVLRMLRSRPERHFRGDPHAIDAIDIASCLPEERTSHILSKLRADPLTPRLEQTLRQGELVPTDVSRRTATRIAEAVQADMSTEHRLEPDQMLVRLIREALFHNHKERRNQASLLLGSSPYGPVLLRHCLELAHQPDELVAMRALTLMLYGAPEDCREGLRELALCGPRRHIRSRALMSLAHMPRGLTPDDEPTVLEMMRTSTDSRAAYAGMYALGMSGAPSLAKIAAGDDELAPTAQWWLDTGSAIHEEA